MLFCKKGKIEYFYTIIDEISGEKYTKLIDFLCSKCNTFSFSIPNFSKTVVTEENADMLSEYEIGYIEEDKEGKEDYRKYRTHIQKYLDSISKYVIKNYYTTEYCRSISAYEKEIYTIELNEVTREFFKNTKSLFEWTYPDFPEDLAFYIDGELYMGSVAHENICDFYMDFKEVKKFLKNTGIDYHKSYYVKQKNVK